MPEHPGVGRITTYGLAAGKPREKTRDTLNGNTTTLFFAEQYAKTRAFAYERSRISFTQGLDFATNTEPQR